MKKTYVTFWGYSILDDIILLYYSEWWIGESSTSTFSSNFNLVPSFPPQMASSILQLLGDLGFAYESHWSRRLQVVGTFSRYLGSQLEVTSSGCGFFEADFACLFRIWWHHACYRFEPFPRTLATMGYSIWCCNLPACAYIHVETCSYTYIHAYMHACIRTYIHTYIHPCMHTYIHTFYILRYTLYILQHYILWIKLN